ncbi:extensin-like domain-containing protein [Gymnodinialimonas ulvae]|uniref:extensin-like domain-containing protein n=1 Tax=Gymnodinialimonas ulvae TaxID=3126504 RepID=UPI0030A2F6E7
MIWRVAVLALGVTLATQVSAQSADGADASATVQAPAASLRPMARPGGSPVPPPEVAASAAEDPPQSAPVVAAQPQNTSEQPGILGNLFRPRAGASAPTVVGGGGSALAVIRSLRPSLRPEGLEGRVRSAATRNTPGTVTRPGQSSGSLCGVVGLQGDVLEPITGRISGCGIQNAVRLRVVHGVQLTQPATINCTTAQSVSQWVLDADEVIGNTGGGIANLRVVASYACRTRNSQRGARLSEHSTGNAIDIAGIGLQNGNELSVLNDWRSGNSGIMRNLHEAACGTFGTVLGPESDRFHQDHFHFDVASYRSGAYCR